ncbi:sensor histidine kinase [Spirosoma endophyticum]|uniref:histidine kinase n=1 Tax=Spirosoma endophyticum TaxID=662367 RepID=A0A1I1SK05_9BACT|nr:HAMP domain-containing sensor histidine kinase [Spirosoma endophyticum]SFD44203.1 Signal transduction histidine kinase [Spirosoma endophyticum]
MTSSLEGAEAPLAQLATYLAARRESLLANWRTACETDHTLKIVASLSREEFNNKVPFMLNVLQQQLGGQDQKDQIGLLAAEHGLHRWQKGYALVELSAEMQHLSNILLGELRLCWQLYPAIDRQAMATAYEFFATFTYQINVGSLQQYDTLQRTTALSRVEVLEKTLTQLTQLSRQRSDLLHQSSHDLRGSFGIIAGAASMLELTSDSEEDRQQFLAMLQRNLANSRHLVTRLIEVARLEAGQETLNIKPLDAGQLLINLVAGYQTLAAERGLLLKADGPAALPVESDPVQLQRIIQNLVLNALKHTATGFVSVSWSRENDYRWIVSVQDSGPGLPTASQVGSLPQLLAPSPESTAAFGVANPQDDARQAVTMQASRSAFAHQGEGIGLSIVKGLCELLRAQLEIESEPGKGTLIRIRLAIHWKY